MTTLNQHPAAASDATGSPGTIKSSFVDDPRMRAIIPEFVEGLAVDVHKMTDSLARNDLPALQRVVHQLLGASGGYGFDDLTKPAATAEESIKTGKPLELIAGEINSLIGVIRRIEGFDDTIVNATTTKAVT